MGTGGAVQPMLRHTEVAITPQRPTWFSGPKKNLLLQADRACFLKVCSLIETGESKSERVNGLCSLEMITNYLSVG